MHDPRHEFRFLQCLGKGGFGEVYLASVRREGGLERKMAVKVLQQGLQNEAEAISRLRDEAHMLALLDHPGILRAHELTRIDGRVALVTEYVEGIDLAYCTQRGNLLPPRVVLGALAEVAAALDSALTTISPETGKPLGLIHRDIKPENIRISVHGQVKLLDFGIARTNEMQRSAKTAIGDLPFTPGYAAPEAFTRGVQSAASDVYALGVTMFRLLAGERLYEGMDLGKQVATASMPASYQKFLDDRLKLVKGDPAVREQLALMLAHDPKARPTAAKVHIALNDLVDDLRGPTLVRWARSVTFPPVHTVEGASLTGKTIKETPPTGNAEIGSHTNLQSTPQSRPGPASSRGGPAPVSSSPRLSSASSLANAPTVHRIPDNKAFHSEPSDALRGAARQIQRAGRSPHQRPAQPSTPPPSLQSAPSLPSGLHTVKPVTGKHRAGGPAPRAHDSLDLGAINPSRALPPQPSLTPLPPSPKRTATPRPRARRAGRTPAPAPDTKATLANLAIVTLGAIALGLMLLVLVLVAVIFYAGA